MAYYNQGDFNGDYHYYHSSNSNYSTYNYNYPVPVQHSSYNNSSIDYQIHGYDSTPSSISYSVSTLINPNYIQYEYPPANSDSSAQTQFIISYSLSNFNADDYDEFDEYDPTPYDGGYDLALTYGNPLPPSVETCYPRSASSSAASAPISVPPAPISTPAAKTEAETASGGQTDVVREEESESTASGRHNNVVEEESNFEGGSGGGEVVSYGDEKRVGEMPYGYGLEAMDICEGLFGYWPCVDRSRRRMKEDCEKDEDCENCRNENSQWDVTSDYLFGNPNPYAQTGGYVDHYDYGPQNYRG